VFIESSSVSKSSELKLYGDNLAPLFVIFAASLCTVDSIVLRLILCNLPVSIVVFVESLIAAVLITPFMLWKFTILRGLSYKDWLSFFAVTLLGEAIGTVAITKALFYIN